MMTLTHEELDKYLDEIIEKLNQMDDREPEFRLKLLKLSWEILKKCRDLTDDKDINELT